ncbi:cell division protein FtsZ [Hymenobacter busanensis]|uniref:Cell division protein FtsZ n=1 Tax=Hymenobacter busanensis TaxID=2607656 RepID=A0A7L4ZUM0_9BACT|nr:cell division protein FtsZ [Hymenobacter busanensis]KAA9339114.1 cell division protein FtsZ [Hymenobacter busanensis]QHJ07124.1 cell division protein FtsZ [Hymenobacter busanensis]
MDFKFDITPQGKSIIKVIGVGGGGSNAVNHMFAQGIKDVEFIICNTDKQALQSSTVPNRLQIGVDLTEGLGAGANPERGKQAAIESREQIRELLSNGTKMVFITAGMGGGTGTGAAPVIAKVAKELGILTVGIVTAPFMFEGRRKRQQAEQGIRDLSENCDTVLVILNDKLREMYGNLPIRSAFAKADNVLSTAAKSIAEIITVTADVNVDFEDVKTVMKDSGAAVMGSAITEGESRARRAAEESLASPLLNNTDIHGAQKILLSIMSGDQAELEMDELTEITEYIQDKAGQDAEVIFGHGIDPTLGQSIRVTVIATGFAHEGHSITQPFMLKDSEPEAAPAVTADPQINLFDKDRQDAARPVVAGPVVSTPVASVEYPPVVAGPVVTPTAEAPKVTYELDQSASPYVPPVVFPASAAPEPLVVQQAPTAPAAPAAPAQSRQALDARAEERRRRLMELSNGLSNDAVKEQLEVPAYLRRQVKLENVQPSSERNISRFNLSDDNELLGDNRFLHDNVD